MLSTSMADSKMNQNYCSSEAYNYVNDVDF